MYYSIKVNEVDNGSNLKGMASVVFGDAYKVTNIAIKDGKNGLYVEMPKYKTSKVGEDGNNIYENIFNPITAEFGKEFNENILKAYENGEDELVIGSPNEDVRFTPSVTPLGNEGNVVGYGRLYINDCFIIKNITIVNGKNGEFVSNPSIKTKQTDENGNAVYKDVCYPITAEAREDIYNKTLDTYKQAKEPENTQAKTI